MKVLITGATGFIGNHVINEFLKYDFDIIATSRNIDKAKKMSWFDKVAYIQCDLNSSNTDFYELFKKPNLLIHLAWEGLPNYNELFHIEKNLYSNYYFIKNMIENGLKKISVIGTCLEYGLKNGCINENTETSPVTSYGLAKDSLRKFVEELKKHYDFNYNWIRLFYIYGSEQKNSIFSQLNTALRNNENVFNMSGGEQLRDYLPVEKVGEYIVKISIQDKINGIFNCCSGQPISIRKLIENYLQEKKQDILLNLGYYPYLSYEPFAFWGDNTKLKEVLAHNE